jgi:choline dehydrogenase
MGPETDADAVVDHHGRVYGLANLFVADASVMPTIPRANTHLPVLAVAERIADALRQGRGSVLASPHQRGREEHHRDDQRSDN